MPAYDAESFSG